MFTSLLHYWIIVHWFYNLFYLDMYEYLNNYYNITIAKILLTFVAKVLTV